MRSLKLGSSLIACMLFVQCNLVPVFAQDSSSSATPVPSPVTYELSYPGMLPDNPFYFLKVARDSLMSFFMGKPLDRAAFYLKQADKNVSASLLLIQEKKDIDMAHTSFIKSQEDFREALTQVSAAKKEGLSTDAISNQLVHASQKYIEVLDGITSQLSDSEAQKFDDVAKVAIQLNQSAASLQK